VIDLTTLPAIVKRLTAPEQEAALTMAIPPPRSLPIYGACGFVGWIVMFVECWCS
jgi:hypothetical protein